MEVIRSSLLSFFALKGCSPFFIKEIRFDERISIIIKKGFEPLGAGYLIPARDEAGVYKVATNLISFPSLPFFI